MSHALRLQQWVDQQKAVFEFSDDDYSSLLVCEILVREISGPNDNLSRYVYDRKTRQKVDKTTLIKNISISEVDNSPVFEITSHLQHTLGISLSCLHQIVSFGDNKIIISPKLIAAYLRERGLKPVFIKAWLQQTLFTNFNLRTESVGDQLWVLRNNDIYLYSKLIAEKKIIMQSSHDIVGHIAGISNDGISYAAEISAIIHEKLHACFGDRGYGNLPSHLLPFLIGLLLDDLAQPSAYFSNNHVVAIKAILQAIDELGIDPQQPLVLNAFPARIINIIQIVREKSFFSPSILNDEIKKFITECKSLISVYHEN